MKRLYAVGVALFTFIAAICFEIIRHPLRTLNQAQAILTHSGGICALWRRIRFYYGMHRALNSGYSQWISHNDLLTNSDQTIIRALVARLRQTPLLSVIMPVYNPPIPYLRAAIESVRAQLYTNWELCIADDASTDSNVVAVLREYQDLDSRVRCAFRSINGHISVASNTALSLANGEFIVLLDQDDVLPEHAMYLVVKEENRQPGADIIYSDEDKIDLVGRRFGPYFKPGWNWGLVRCQNLISHLGVYRTSLVREVGGFREGFEGGQDYDLLLRCAERTTIDRIRHLPHVLYHWRTVPGSTSRGTGAKSYAYDAARRAIQEHLDRCGRPATVDPCDWPGLYRVHYHTPKDPPRVSVVVLAPLPSIESICQTTAWDGVEWLTISEPMPSHETLECDDPPNGRIVTRQPNEATASVLNRAAGQATGDILCFVAGNIQPKDPTWLAELLGLTCHPDIGVVGGAITSRAGAFIHAGYTVTPTAPAGNPFFGVPTMIPGPYGWCLAARDCAAVSAACLTIRREVFDELGGFDVAAFPEIWYDIDLCLRAGDRGYRVVCNPYAQVTSDDESEQVLYPKLADSRVADRSFADRWADRLDPARFFSPNIHTDLIKFRLEIPSPVARPWLHEASEKGHSSREADSTLSTG